MVEGYGVRLVTGGAERRKVAVDYVTKGLASGALRPITDRTFKFDDMTEVTGIWRTAANRGKIQHALTYSSGSASTCCPMRSTGRGSDP